MDGLQGNFFFAKRHCNSKKEKKKKAHFWNFFYNLYLWMTSKRIVTIEIQTYMLVNDLFVILKLPTLVNLYKCINHKKVKTGRKLKSFGTHV